VKHLINTNYQALFHVFVLWYYYYQDISRNFVSNFCIPRRTFCNKPYYHLNTILVLENTQYDKKRTITTFQKSLRFHFRRGLIPSYYHEVFLDHGHLFFNGKVMTRFWNIDVFAGQNPITKYHKNTIDMQFFSFFFIINITIIFFS